MSTRPPSIPPGTPVRMGNTVGHVRSFTRGAWSGRVLVEHVYDWGSQVFFWSMHRDSVERLEGPPLSAEMLKALAARAVLRK